MKAADLNEVAAEDAPQDVALVRIERAEEIVQKAFRSLSIHRLELAEPLTFRDCTFVELRITYIRTARATEILFTGCRFSDNVEMKEIAGAPTVTFNKCRFGGSMFVFRARALPSRPRALHDSDGGRTATCITFRECFHEQPLSVAQSEIESLVIESSSLSGLELSDAAEIADLRLSRVSFRSRRTSLRLYAGGTLHVEKSDFRAPIVIRVAEETDLSLVASRFNDLEIEGVWGISETPYMERFRLEDVRVASVLRTLALEPVREVRSLSQ